MKTLTNEQLSNKIIAFEKAFIELSNAWTEASPEMADALQNAEYEACRGDLQDQWQRTS